MLKDPKMVFEKAEETAAKYHERMEAERRAREEAAKDIVMGKPPPLPHTHTSTLPYPQLIIGHPPLTLCLRLYPQLFRSRRGPRDAVQCQQRPRADSVLGAGD